MTVYVNVIIHFGQNETTNILYKKYVGLRIETTLPKPKSMKIGLLCKYFVILLVTEFRKRKFFRFFR